MAAGVTGDLCKVYGGTVYVVEEDSDGATLIPPGGDPLLAPVGDGTQPRCIGFLTTAFADAHHQEFSDKAPRWRVIGPGLNLEATCQNESCAVKMSKVWIRKGFGKFDIGDALYEAKCPECKEPVKDLVNAGFWDCKYMVEGKQLEPTRKKVSFQGSTNKKTGFLTFSAMQVRYAKLIIEAVRN